MRTLHTLHRVGTSVIRADLYCSDAPEHTPGAAEAHRCKKIGRDVCAQDLLLLHQQQTCRPHIVTIPALQSNFGLVCKM